jgi:hypothetical protein
MGLNTSRSPTVPLYVYTYSIPGTSDYLTIASYAGCGKSSSVAGVVRSPYPFSSSSTIFNNALILNTVPGSNIPSAGFSALCVGNNTDPFLNSTSPSPSPSSSELTINWTGISHPSSNFTVNFNGTTLVPLDDRIYRIDCDRINSSIWSPLVPCQVQGSRQLTTNPWNIILWILILILIIVIVYIIYRQYRNRK